MSLYDVSHIYIYIYIYIHVRFDGIVVSSWQQSMYDSTVLSRIKDTWDASRHNICYSC
jgi:hypothetical protein